MTNSDISDQLNLLSKLMALHDTDDQLSKDLAAAAFQIDRLNSELMIMPRKNILSIRSVSQPIVNFIEELLDTQNLKILNEHILKTPIGIQQILNIKGLGPKKVKIIWKEMGIETPSDLLYACNENRLIDYKGFGEKLQQQVLDATDFFLNSSGKYLFARVQYFSNQLLLYFTKLKNWKASLSGQVVRQLEIIDTVTYIILGEANKIAKQLDAQYFSEININENIITCISHAIHVKIYCANENNFGTLLFETSSSEMFLNSFKEKYIVNNVNEEQDIFKQNNLKYIEPLLREYTIDECYTINENKLIQFADIKGIIHNHSTYSDGSNSLMEMTQACIKAGYEYFVISDHSAYASYAKGLQPERIVAQHLEIDNINNTVSSFKVFKSIECDILPDGSLDYTPEILNSFDIIVASIHSAMNMDLDKAMHRVIKAIENPFTSILGHPTGRLLLGRAGYPLDMKKIIEACAANNVVLELNANPRRLDIDWRWIKYAVEKNVLISINPDAHHIDGIKDNEYGVYVAQKAGLVAKQNLSSFTLQEFEAFIKIQKQKRTNV